MTHWHKLGCRSSCFSPRSERAVGALGDSSSKEVVLVTHEAFAIPKARPGSLRAGDGPELKILQGGDAGEVSTVPR